jgi:hypothetical protein
MKRLAFIIAILFAGSTLLLSCHSRKNGKLEDISSDAVMNPNTATGKADLSKLPAFKFDEEIHDFGKIYEGETVAYDFSFTNVGKSELVIADVSTSCGCTVTEYPKNPIRPGEKGKINVKFNSAGKHGYQSKNIMIAANTQPNTTVIRIKAEVVNVGNR